MINSRSHPVPTYSLWSGGIFLAASLLLAAPSPAQVSGVFKNNNEPVLLGNISVRPSKAQLPAEDADDNGARKVFVEGAVRLAGTVYRLDPASYRVNGEPWPLDLVVGGFPRFLPEFYTARVRFGQYKVTSRQIIEAVLEGRQDSNPIGGFRLLWRGHSNNMAKGFFEKVGNGARTPLQVGVPSLAQRYDAALPHPPGRLQPVMSMDFIGDEVNLERGEVSVRENEARTGSRRGFIEATGQITATAPTGLEVPGNADVLEFSGMLNIRRNLRTIGPETENFGPAAPEIGETYEVGRMSGRFYGVATEWVQ